MSLLVVNTGAPVVLAAGNPIATIPAGTVNDPTLFNVTPYMIANNGAAWAALEAQRAALNGQIKYGWSGPVNFATGTLVLSAPSATSNWFIIGPSLNGIVGNGVVDDAPAIQAYLNSIQLSQHNVFYNVDNPIGAYVWVLTGQYRLASTITINNTFVFQGQGSNSPNSGCYFMADAGVTAFYIPNSANGTTIRDIFVVAAGKSPPANANGSLANDPGNAATTGGAGSYHITLTNAGDAGVYHNGDVIRVEGASLVAGDIYNLQVQTTINQAQATYNNPDGNLYCGLYPGQWLTLPGAWTRTRVLSVDYVGHTFTMASNAAATLHFGAANGSEPRVSWIPDAIVQIQSGGGTVNLVVDDNALGVTVATYLHPYASAFYARTEIHFEHIWVYGFKGAGLVHQGDGSFSPNGFSEFSTVFGFDVFNSGYGFYGKGVDCNTTTYTNMSANFIDECGMYTEQHIGVSFNMPIVQGAYIGFAGGYTSNQSLTSINQYSEGTTNSYGGGIITVGGGAIFSGQVLGLLIDGTIRQGGGFFIDAGGRVGSFSSPTLSVWDPIGGNGRVALRTDSAVALTTSTFFDFRSAGTSKYTATTSTFKIPTGVTMTDQGNTGAQIFFGTAGGAAALVFQSGDIAPNTSGGMNLGNASAQINNIYCRSETIEKDAVGVSTTTYGLQVINTTAATAGLANQQFSPVIQQVGQSWSGAVSQVIGWDVQIRPFTGGSAFSQDYTQVVGAAKTRLMGFFNQTPNQGSVGWASASSQDIAIEAGSLTNDGSVNANGLFISHLGNSNANGLVSILLSGVSEFQFRFSANKDGATPTGFVPRVDAAYWLGSSTGGGGTNLRWGGLFNAGALGGKYNTQAGATYTVIGNAAGAIADFYVGMSNAGARTVTLCAANSFYAGQMLIVNDENGNALTNNITINRAGADTIDGGTNFVINTNKGDIWLISDGTSKWFTIARGL